MIHSKFVTTRHTVEGAILSFLCILSSRIFSQGVASLCSLHNNKQHGAVQVVCTSYKFNVSYYLFIIVTTLLFIYHQ